MIEMEAYVSFQELDSYESLYEFLGDHRAKMPSYFMFLTSGRLFRIFFFAKYVDGLK